LSLIAGLLTVKPELLQLLYSPLTGPPIRINNLRVSMWMGPVKNCSYLMALVSQQIILWSRLCLS